MSNEKSLPSWQTTANRFVAFFDILGFKDLVLKSSHAAVLEKLTKLKDQVDDFEKLSEVELLKTYNTPKDQTKSVSFSDSFIFFSKADDYKDALKLLADSYNMIRVALESNLPIKGAISYGVITVDFKKSLFFGQPIIDSFLLHNELQMLTVIMDEKFDVKFKELKKNDPIKKDDITGKMLTTYKANLKSGRITHTLIRPVTSTTLDNTTESIIKLYDLVSGRPRLYIDNTLEFLRELKKVHV